MSRFNTAVRTGVRSPITSTTPATTALGAPGFSRDARSELFLLAVSNMASPSGTYHEAGKERDERFRSLVTQVAADTEWMLGFLGWLRDEANMRSASIMAAADAVKARLAARIFGNREIIDRVLQRADEPGELLAYWTSTYGRPIPSAVKRGINDAVARLYGERSLLKWDSDSRNFRFADVINLTRPDPLTFARSDLYKYALETRYKGNEAVPAKTLRTITARRKLLATPVEQRHEVTSGQLGEAGMTWESTAGWMQGPMDAKAWEAAIPNMGYMALLRNLRNFDQAGISDTAAAEVREKLTDPEEVKRSRQLPMRFLSAYRATQNSGTVSGWGPTIEKALNLSLRNIPQLTGNTLILVDVSGSMTFGKLSDRSDLTWKDAAALFGAALARCNDSDLYAFDDSIYQAKLAGRSVLPVAEACAQLGGGGTRTAAAIQATFRRGFHDRIVIVTDEQASGSYYSGNVNEVLAQCGVPSYTWNLAGYKVGHAESGSQSRHTFGGLSDQAFKMIPLIEAGEHQRWPWS